MPELPDLQVFSRNLQKKIAGRKVKKGFNSSYSKAEITGCENLESAGRREG